MLLKFKEHITEEFPELLDNPILIGCSGGIDSIVLVDLCHQLGLTIAIAHCNFKLRGAESDLDEKFVKQYAAQLSIPFYTTSFNTQKYVDTHKVSVQIAARELRYRWFEELSQQTNIPYLLTAHHQNDSIESFFINASRGSGVDGLIGIPPKRAIYRRPLLAFNSFDIENYAESRKLSWREDASNKDTKYLRNQVRHQLIPEFLKLHPTAQKNLLQTQKNLQSTRLIAAKYLEVIKSELFVKEAEMWSVSIKRLQSLNPMESLVYELFKPYGFLSVEALLDLCESISGKKLISSTHILLKDRESLLLKELNDTTTTEVYLVEDTVSEIKEPLNISFKEVTSIGETSDKVIYVDLDKLHFPLRIRKAEEGDFIKPYGLDGSKKLSKFFKDEKYSQFEKEDQWLLCDATNSIMWIIGKRADRRFKVSDHTTNVLKITIINH